MFIVARSTSGRLRRICIKFGIKKMDHDLAKAKDLAKAQDLPNYSTVIYMYMYLHLSDQADNIFFKTEICSKSQKLIGLAFSFT